MRRQILIPVVLALVVAAGAVGCGGSTAKPADVVEQWSQAINGGDNEAAADLFADGATVSQDGRTATLAGHDEALAFNASLPCGAKIVDQSGDGNNVTATFTLTRRPEHMCDGTGEAAVVVFAIEDGKIVSWEQAPPESNSGETS